MRENVAQATARVPDDFRNEIAGMAHQGGTREGAPSGRFDAARVKGDLNARFDTLESLADLALHGNAAAAQQLLADPRTDARLRAALQGPPAGAAARAQVSQGVHAGLERARAEALATADRVNVAMKRAFTQAVASLYRVAILFALLGFLVTLLLPEKPLRGRQTAGAEPVPPALPVEG
jgi:hypothetical protein